MWKKILVSPICQKRQRYLSAIFYTNLRFNHEKVFKPPEDFSKGAHIKSLNEYKSLYKKSIQNPEEFWKNLAKDYIHFEQPQPGGKEFCSYNFNVDKGPIFIKYFEGAKTNICYNILDKNIKEKGIGSNVAYYWEGNDPKDSSTLTYKELLAQVCKCANALKKLGIKKGDRVGIYMPMIPELVISMLACARIGAVHSIVFGGFSSDSLADRMIDGKVSILLTTDGVWRGDKLVPLKEIADQAMKSVEAKGHAIKSCVVVNHLSRLSSKNSKDYKAPYNKGRDLIWSDLLKNESEECAPTWVDAEDPLFLLYTSGSTGKPKGVLHSNGGYLLFTATTFKYVFDYHPGNIYWCTADIGWITGHSYVCYGPLANGATSVMFEGIPTFPDNSRFWAVIEKYKVNQFYTAPTAIRSLMKYGNKPVEKHNRDSLKLLGTVGEPINPEAWYWFQKVVGNSKCPIVDTYWQTETGGHILTPLPGAIPTKPGSATFPFFGVVPSLLSSENGKEVVGEGEGDLVFNQPWPGIMRTVYGDHARFESAYFKRHTGYYVTGDAARRDKDGYLWITGRVDDMLNVSGHLISTTEVESCLNEHDGVIESAAVAMNHPVKGQALYCFVSLKDGYDWNDSLVNDLKKHVREKIGAFASPEILQEAPQLPKTRSGKIMRRILRKIAANEIDDLGDTSTLADESVVQELIKNRPSPKQ